MSPPPTLRAITDPWYRKNGMFPSHPRIPPATSSQKVPRPKPMEAPAQSGSQPNRKSPATSRGGRAR
jgi:hypothetical protein